MLMLLLLVRCLNSQQIKDDNMSAPGFVLFSLQPSGQYISCWFTDIKSVSGCCFTSQLITSYKLWLDLGGQSCVYTPPRRLNLQVVCRKTNELIVWHREESLTTTVFFPFPVLSLVAKPDTQHFSRPMMLNETEGGKHTEVLFHWKYFCTEKRQENWTLLQKRLVTFW